jgi:hypothetical protein
VSDMSPALALAEVLEHVAAARLAPNRQGREVLFALASRALDALPLDLTSVRGFLASARIAGDARDRNAWFDLAERALREALAELTPVQPVVLRETLRKSSTHFKAVRAELAEGRAAAGIATPPKGTTREGS